MRMVVVKRKMLSRSVVEVVSRLGVGLVEHAHLLTLASAQGLSHTAAAAAAPPPPQLHILLEFFFWTTHFFEHLAAHFTRLWLQ